MRTHQSVTNYCLPMCFEETCQDIAVGDGFCLSVCLSVPSSSLYSRSYKCPKVARVMDAYVSNHKMLIKMNILSVPLYLSLSHAVVVDHPSV